MMRTALENLLGNAWKYSSRVEQARIEVGAAEVEGRPKFLIRDNGTGFDMKDARRARARTNPRPRFFARRGPPPPQVPRASPTATTYPPGSTDHLLQTQNPPSPPPIPQNS
jgi:hypothetical protein